jgi:hypothetical protein
MTDRLLPILVTCDRCMRRPGTISDPWSGELLCEDCNDKSLEEQWMAQQERKEPSVGD